MGLSSDRKVRRKGERSGSIHPVELPWFDFEGLGEDVDGVGGRIDLPEFDPGDLGIGQACFECKGFNGKIPSCADPSKVPAQLQTECILAFHRSSPKVAGRERVFKSMNALLWGIIHPGHSTKQFGGNRRGAYLCTPRGISSAG